MARGGGRGRGGGKVGILSQQRSGPSRLALTTLSHKCAVSVLAPCCLPLVEVPLSLLVDGRGIIGPVIGELPLLSLAAAHLPSTDDGPVESMDADDEPVADPEAECVPVYDGDEIRLIAVASTGRMGG